MKLLCILCNLISINCLLLQIINFFLRLGNCTFAKQDKRGVLGCLYVAMRRLKAAPAEELQLLLHYETHLFFTNRLTIATTMYALYLTTQPVCSTQIPHFDPATSLRLPHLTLRTAFCFGNFEQSNPMRSHSENKYSFYRMPPMITGCPQELTLW
jgi:hypothetical protein